MHGSTACCHDLQAYIVQLAKLLVQLGNNPGNYALQQRLEQATHECNQLLGMIT